MKRQWAAALCMVVGLFSGCTARPVTSSGEVSVHISSAAYHKITPEEAKDRMDAGGVTIVDVRRGGEKEAWGAPKKAGKCHPLKNPPLHPRRSAPGGRHFPAGRPRHSHLSLRLL